MIRSEPVNPADLGNANVDGFFASIFGPTRVTAGSSSVMDPSAPEFKSNSIGSVSSAFQAVKSAAARVLLFGPAAPVADAAAKVGDASAAAIKSGADAVAAAGSGIYSGFKWAIVIVGLLIGLYMVSLLVAITPRRMPA